jgi:hypothetical protein
MQKPGSAARILPCGAGRNRKKENHMNASERIVNLERLESLCKLVNQLRVSLPTQGCHEADYSLIQIWDTSQELQRMLCNQAVIEGFRRDAMAQSARVCELIFECDLFPDDRQFASIGYACDLAAEKIKHYQRMANFAAQLEALTGEPITEGA